MTTLFKRSYRLRDVDRPERTVLLQGHQINADMGFESEQIEQIWNLELGQSIQISDGVSQFQTVTRVDS